jgi:hypothetical protein
MRFFERSINLVETYQGLITGKKSTFFGPVTLDYFSAFHPGIEITKVELVLFCKNIYLIHIIYFLITNTRFCFLSIIVSFEHWKCTECSLKSVKCNRMILKANDT